MIREQGVQSTTIKGTPFKGYVYLLDTRCKCTTRISLIYLADKNEKSYRVCSCDVLCGRGGEKGRNGRERKERAKSKRKKEKNKDANEDREGP